MKLLHCLSSPHVGGIERLVIELAIEQRRVGIDVSIMLDTREGLYYEYLKNQNIPLLDSGIKGALDFNYKTYRQLKQVFKAFDIVHLHSFSPIRLIALVHSRVKAIYTIHGLSKGIREESKVKYLLRESIKTHYLNKVDVAVANSNYTLSLAKKHYGLKKTKSLCILNGIKLPELTTKLNKLNDEFTIGLTSRFTKRKRIDRLVSAFKKYLKAGGAGKLILVGDGAEFNTIKSMVNNLELAEKVEMVGYVSNVKEYYDQFDLCVFPSQEEPFGLVAVEAYLQGKAVLAFNASEGLKEVIEPLEPDNIVHTIDELSSRLLFWSKNRDQLQENASKRKAYAAKNFSVERMNNDYLNVYRELLKN